jgi:hypothetical protein
VLVGVGVLLVRTVLSLATGAPFSTSSAHARHRGRGIVILSSAVLGEPIRCRA